MYLVADTIDDLLRGCIEKIINNESIYKVSPTKGVNFEIPGASLRLNNPLARLSTSLIKSKFFSPLGELLWYLNGSNELAFIQYYINDYSKFSDDHSTLYGAYGPRLINKSINQIENIITKLKNKESTRQAIIQIFDTKDLTIETKDLPCTIFLQFLIRNGQLHMFTSMRSNDLFKGFIHDVFSFTMIQEIIARELNVELGFYNHFVTSLHLYESDRRKAESYFDEGFQSTKLHMSAMPTENLQENLKFLLEYESLIRNRKEYDIDSLTINVYWKDLIYLLDSYRHYKANNISGLAAVKEKITDQFFRTFLAEKILYMKDDRNI